MTPPVLRAGDREAAPWKNGGGVTREIAAVPQGAGPTGFDWRISLADAVADGPFSVFPGADRILTVVEGAGMDLTVDGTSRRAEPFVPGSFPGDVPTACRLPAGPVRNLNVMYRRDRISAAVGVVRGGGRLLVPVRPGTTVVAVALEGVALLRDVPPGDIELRAYDAVLLAHPGPGRPDPVLYGEGRTALITLRHG